MASLLGQGFPSSPLVISPLFYWSTSYKHTFICVSPVSLTTTNASLQCGWRCQRIGLLCYLGMQQFGFYRTMQLWISWCTFMHPWNKTYIQWCIVQQYSSIFVLVAIDVTFSFSPVLSSQGMATLHPWPGCYYVLDKILELTRSFFRQLFLPWISLEL